MTIPSTDSRYPRKPAWPLLALIMLGGIFLSLQTEHWVGDKPSPVCLIHDALQSLLVPINAYVSAHATLADILMVVYSTLGDAVVLTLIICAIVKRSVRPVLPLLVFMILRQIMQVLVSFPVNPDLIWHYPGFPSLFANYRVSGDFYFSGYVGIVILAALEFKDIFHLKWLTICSVILVFFVVFTDLILRTHYSTDVYTSIITAVFSYLFMDQFIPAVDKFLKKIDRISHFLLIFSICLLIASVFATQYFIAEKIPPICGIDDLVQSLFLPFNNFLTIHQGIGNGFLIGMNFLLDCMFVFMIADTIVTRNIRPFLTFSLFFVLRQTMQLLISLPLPPDVIWHYPGFPSLLQNYSIINDLYFSGHAGISLIVALEMSSFGKKWLTILGFSICALECFLVIAMQIHYTMDVFTAIMTVFCITDLSCHWAHPINTFLAKIMKSD